VTVIQLVEKVNNLIVSGSKSESDLNLSQFLCC